MKFLNFEKFYKTKFCNQFSMKFNAESDRKVEKMKEVHTI
jgi:hypothetical protein